VRFSRLSCKRCTCACVCLCVCLCVYCMLALCESSHNYSQPVSIIANKPSSVSSPACLRRSASPHGTGPTQSMQTRAGSQGSMGRWPQCTCHFMKALNSSVFCSRACVGIKNQCPCHLLRKESVCTVMQVCLHCSRARVCGSS